MILNKYQYWTKKQFFMKKILGRKQLVSLELLKT